VVAVSLALILALTPLAACEGDGTTSTSDGPVAGLDATGGSDTAPAAPGDAATPPEDAAAPPEDVTAPPEDVTAPPEDVTAPPEDVTAPPEDVTTPPEDTATPPEDTATPSAGACDNAADLAAFETAGAIDGHVSACVSQCLTSGQLNATCYSGCVQQRTGLSAPCSACFGQVMQCTVTNCALRCLNPASADCTACRDEKCTPAFTECAGVTNPG
jgi:hypothetical protein